MTTTIAVIPRVKLMVADRDGRWVCSSETHQLERLLPILQPGERVYRVTWSEHWWSRGTLLPPRLALVHGDRSLARPRLTIERVRASFGAPCTLPPPCQRAARKRKMEQAVAARRRRRALLRGAA